MLWRALLFESALLLGAGCSIGALFGLYGQLLLSHALASVTGFPVVFSVGAFVCDGQLRAGHCAWRSRSWLVPGYLAAGCASSHQPPGLTKNKNICFL